MSCRKNARSGPSYVETADAQGIAKSSKNVQPRFEVATIKPATSGDFHSGLHVSQDRVTVQNMSLKQLIQFAYELKTDAQISSGPSWISSKRYDIIGTIDTAAQEQADPAAKGETQARLMLQSLLSERFNLKISRQMKVISVYALELDKHGAELMSSKRSADGAADKKVSGISINNGTLTATAVPLKALADVLARQPELGNRPVVDKSD